MYQIDRPNGAFVKLFKALELLILAAQLIQT